ncbi:MAG: tyrosine--tRNA ligase [Acidiphilium sp.]|nr:tyrosine--tRNA ligase [Acidiphilium sp.]MDD4934834.1 tyrosine--tRNA ligase [Acidiphilium sp.]
MMSDTSDFLREAEARGFIFQCTDPEGLAAAMRAAPVAGYIGFDCTADGLHVGSLVQIMLLRLLQRYGHKPIALMGGGTSRIGDPSGRDAARQMLTDDDIARNMAGIRANLAAFISFGTGAGDALQLNNADWLEKLGYIDVLRDVGPHFSINRMMTMDSVKSRLDRESAFSFLEFNYAILQGYDFRELNRRYGVTLQMGGSDQWGNIVQGMELVRRTDGTQVFGLTTPLIATASGVKMGKTAAGAVWLSAEKRSPFDYWQFWRNTEDADVGRFLRLFTDLPLAEITRLEALGGAEINEAKKILATEATTLCHGHNAAQAAAETARQTFEAGQTADTLPGIDVPLSELGAGVPAIALLVRAGLAASNGEARRLIRGGGARLNDALITDEAQTVTLADLIDGVAKLSAGRKQHRLVRAG